MDLIQRYKSNINGNMIFTGNTLGLCRDDTLYGETSDSIGAFTSLDNSLKVGSYPNGTTLDYTKNGSSAVLNIPDNSTIEYCELIWSGSYQSNQYSILPILNNDVIFVTPDGIEHSVSPCEETRINNEVYSVHAYYTRSADITDIVKHFTSGTYSIKSVPGLINEDDKTQIYLGWTLAVVYKNPTESAKNFVLWVGNVDVQLNETVDCTLDCFITPASTPIGKILISAGEGDASRDGEQVYFGKDIDNLHQLSTPNNSAVNFMCSQINDSNGQLDTSGTFGNRNQDPVNHINYPYARQGYDITTANVSDYVEPMQTSAIIRIKTTGDMCILNAVALDLEGTPFVTTLSHKLEVNKSYTTVDDTITYKHTITNTGTETLNNLLFVDDTPQDTEHIIGSVAIDGVYNPTADPNSGIFLGTLAPGGSKQITNQVLVTDNNNKKIANTAYTSYSYQMPDSSTKMSSADSNLVETTNLSTDFSKVKTSSATFLTAGESTTQTITLTNNTDTDITGIYFTDTITGSATFVAGSVAINGTTQPDYNIITGFAIPNIAVGDTLTVSYKIVANNAITSPTISNTASIAYVIDDPTAGPTTFSEKTNTVTMDAVSTTIIVNKSANKSYALSADTILYTIVVTNKSTLTATNTTFTDTIPSGTTFVAGSVIIDGTSQPTYDPNTGFALATLAPNASTTITFSVIVD